MWCKIRRCQGRYFGVGQDFNVNPPGTCKARRQVYKLMFVWQPAVYAYTMVKSKHITSLKGSVWDVLWCWISWTANAHAVHLWVQTWVHACALAVHQTVLHAFQHVCCVTRSGSKKSCLAVPCPSRTLKDMVDMYNYSLEPQVCLPSLQEYKCIWHCEVQIHVWQKYTAGDLADIP